MKKKKHKAKRPNKRRQNSQQPPVTKSVKPSNVIKLTDVRISGFSVNNALSGETAEVLFRAGLTSDEREFHVYMDGITNIIASRAKEAGVLLSPDYIWGFSLIIQKDGAATLSINSFPMSVEVLAKRPMKAGEIIYSTDIGDIRRVSLREPNLNPHCKVIVCCKVGWKFGLFFDLGDNRELDIDRMERELGALYRRLRFQALYEALADPHTVDQMTAAGWFPFVEVIGGDIDPLLKAYKSDFNIEAQENALVAKFTSERIDRIASRWWQKPAIEKHQKVLQAGLEAFKNGDYVSSIKNILTEIEGILANIHLAEVGSPAKTRKLLEHAVNKGVVKADGEASLLFPEDFLEYLSSVTYADFDPSNPVTASASRHTVSHGVATGEAYTSARATQVILTLDQIAFYL